MSFAVVWSNRAFLLQGFLITLQMAALVILGGTVFGIGLGMLRTSRLPLARQLATGYIEGIRGTPLLVVLFVVYFGLPPVIGYKLKVFEAAVVGFVLFIGAYIAEDYRSGLASVPRGQIEAGLATGLSPPQVLRHIVLPQAIRRMIPAFFNQFVRLLKFTSVASVMGVMELTGAALTVNAREFQPFPILIALAATYLVVCSLLSLLGRWLHAHFAISA